MLALLCVIWGLTFPVTKSALDTIDPMQFLTLRFGIAAIILVPIVLSRRGRRPSQDKSGKLLPDAACPPAGSTRSVLVEFLQKFESIWLRGALVGLLLFIGFTLQVYGMRFTTASRSGFFTGLLVVIAPLLAFFLRTSRTPVASWLGIVPALTGVFLLSNPGAGGLNLGDWLTIGCASVFALQMIVLEAAAKPHDSILEFTLAQVLVVLMCGTVWCIVEGASLALTTGVWVALVYTGVFGSMVAVWLQTRFQPMVPAGHAALVFTLEPVFAAGFACILLGETWTKAEISGAGLILVGMIVSSAGLSRKSGFYKMERNS